MANRWTKEQKQAIDARGSDLLIAAAAGSGKTAVLVERIITKLLREGQEIDRLLVVTFTNAAASEMRQRIGVAIAKQLEETPEDIHLQNQMAFLPRADIKTIHAFCLQVIREYYHLTRRCALPTLRKSSCCRRRCWRNYSRRFMRQRTASGFLICWKPFPPPRRIRPCRIWFCSCIPLRRAARIRNGS